MIERIQEIIRRIELLERPRTLATLIFPTDGKLVVPKYSADPTGQAGEIYFNTTTNTFRKHNGTIWSDL